jgi:RHH-type transcriptional regulator, rel operon repressor / antitoxin RelB
MLAGQTGRSSEELAEEALKKYVEYECWKANEIRDAAHRADAGDFATDEEMDAVFDRYRRAADASVRKVPDTFSLRRSTGYRTLHPPTSRTRARSASPSLGCPRPPPFP